MWIRFSSFAHAVSGFLSFLRTEKHAAVHTLCAIGVIALGIYYRISLYSWALLFVAIGLVLVAEMLNTAVERLIDKLHPEQDQTIGQVKDIAAGAVLISAVTALLIGIAVFWDYVIG